MALQVLLLFASQLLVLPILHSKIRRLLVESSNGIPDLMVQLKSSDLDTE